MAKRPGGKAEFFWLKQLLRDFREGCDHASKNSGSTTETLPFRGSRSAPSAQRHAGGRIAFRTHGSGRLFAIADAAHARHGRTHRLYPGKFKKRMASTPSCSMEALKGMAKGRPLQSSIRATHRRLRPICRTFDLKFGLPDPPSFKIVNVHGSTNPNTLPLDDVDTSVEIALDVELLRRRYPAGGEYFAGGSSRSVLSEFGGSFWIPRKCI